MDKIFKSLNSINLFSKKIIFYGSIIVLSCCFIGVSIILYNNAVAQELSIYEIGKSIIQTSTTVYAQIVIGALIMDFFNIIIKNNS